MASTGVSLIGSPWILKDVFNSTGIPVIDLNLSIRLKKKVTDIESNAKFKYYFRIAVPFYTVRDCSRFEKELGLLSCKHILSGRSLTSESTCLVR